MRYYKELGLRVGIACLLNPFVLYFLFFPLTLILTYVFLFWMPATLSFAAKTILIRDVPFQFIKACIAPSAYFLLTLLVMLTKDISWKVRIKSWLTGVALILGMNILRIIVVIFVFLYLGKGSFDSIHLFFWDFFSTLYVFFVWVFLVYKFKIKSIPLVGDVKTLYRKIKH